MTLDYEQIFSRYRGIVDDPKELALDADDFLELCTERLHMSIADPRVIAKFSTISLDDEIQEIEFELKNPVSDFADSEFVIKLLSWLLYVVTIVTDDFVLPDAFFTISLIFPCSSSRLILLSTSPSLVTIMTFTGELFGMLDKNRISSLSFFLYVS